MADSKITALTALTAADPVNDMFPIVDVSDTTMAASGTTKKISVNNILGASGTATLASATITGALTSGTTTLVSHAAGYTGKVGVGTATPTDTLDVNGRVTALRYLSSSSNASLPSFAVAAGNGIYNSGANEIGFAINSANAMTLNASGNLVFPTGKGIDFSAVTGGTGTATGNVLNDYEEGTFTATLNGSVSDPATLITTVGRYTKVGREVTVEINFQNITTTGYSGRITIAGLPFAQNGNNEIASIVGLYGIATFTGSPFGLTTQSATTISMWSSISNGAFQAVNFNVGSGQYLWSSLTYTV